MTILTEESKIKEILTKSNIKSDFNVETFKEYVRTGKELIKEDRLPFLIYSGFVLNILSNEKDIKMVKKTLLFVKEYPFSSNIIDIAITVTHLYPKFFLEIYPFFTKELELDDKYINSLLKKEQ